MLVDLEQINLIKDIFTSVEQIKQSLENHKTKRWLSVKELSEYLSYSKDRIYKLKEEQLLQDIHFYKKSGKILFDRVAIDDWIVGKDIHDSNKSQRCIVDNILSSIQKD